MRYSFTPLSEEEAREIAGWRYAPPYDFYNADADQGDLQELLDRASPYYAVCDGKGELIGFFCFKGTAQVPAGLAAGAYDDPAALDIGLGMRPDLTGQDQGLAFVLAGLDFARRTFAPGAFRLSVATFNSRAIRVYERAGFVAGTRFMHHTNGGEHEFLCMTRGETGQRGHG